MSNQPTHHVYFVVDLNGEDKKSLWHKIGAAWPHRDGKGFSVELKMIPVTNRDTLTLTLRERQENPETSPQDIETA